jgi:cytochrome c5
MAGPHSHDSASHDSQSNPVRLAIAITLGAVAVIIAIILLVEYAVGSYGARSRQGEPAMKPEAVAERIAPVAKLALDPNAPAAPAAPAAPVASPTIPPPAATKTAAAGGDGKAAYDATCNVCHGTGVAGAPKLGDKAAWAPRIKQGIGQLHTSALKGKGAMPPKGGNTALSDDAVKAAVDFMVAAAK